MAYTLDELLRNGAQPVAADAPPQRLTLSQLMSMGAQPVDAPAAPSLIGTSGFSPDFPQSVLSNPAPLSSIPPQSPPPSLIGMGGFSQDFPQSVAGNYAPANDVVGNLGNAYRALSAPPQQPLLPNPLYGQANQPLTLENPDLREQNYWNAAADATRQFGDPSAGVRANLAYTGALEQTGERHASQQFVDLDPTIFTPEKFADIQRQQNEYIQQAMAKGEQIRLPDDLQVFKLDDGRIVGGKGYRAKAVTGYIENMPREPAYVNETPQEQNARQVALAGYTRANALPFNTPNGYSPRLDEVRQEVINPSAPDRSAYDDFFMVGGAKAANARDSIAGGATALAGQLLNTSGLDTNVLGQRDLRQAGEGMIAEASQRNRQLPAAKSTGIDGLLQDLPAGAMTMIPTIGATLLAGPAGGMAVGFGIEASATYADILDGLQQSGRPVTQRDRETAAVLAVAVGGVNGALEMAGAAETMQGAFIRKAFRDIARESLSPASAARLLQTAERLTARVASGAAGEALTEAIQEVNSMAASGAAPALMRGDVAQAGSDALVAIDPNAAVQAGLIGGLLGGAGGVFGGNPEQSPRQNLSTNDAQNAQYARNLQDLAQRSVVPPQEPTPDIEPETPVYPSIRPDAVGVARNVAQASATVIPAVDPEAGILPQGQPRGGQPPVDPGSPFVPQVDERSFVPQVDPDQPTAEDIPPAMRPQQPAPTLAPAVVDTPTAMEPAAPPAVEGTDVATSADRATAPGVTATPSLMEATNQLSAISGRMITGPVAEKVAGKVLEAIQTGQFNDILHPDNKNSRKLFEQLTGQKLPKGLAATKATFTGSPFQTSEPKPTAAEAAPTREDIESGKNLVDNILPKIDELVNRATNDGQRPMDTNWERKAVKRFIDTELSTITTGPQYGNRAAAKIAISKAATFEELKAAVQKAHKPTNPPPLGPLVVQDLRSGAKTTIPEKPTATTRGDTVIPGDGIEAKVFRRKDGTWGVTVHDIDSGKNITDTVQIYPEYRRDDAVKYATEQVTGKSAPTTPAEIPAPAPQKQGTLTPEPVNEQQPDKPAVLQATPSGDGESVGGTVGEDGTRSLDRERAGDGNEPAPAELPEGSDDRSPGGREEPVRGTSGERVRSEGSTGDSPEGVRADRPARTDGPDGAERGGSEPTRSIPEDAGRNTQAVSGNYVIPDANSLHAGGVKQKFRNNVKAIETLRLIESESRGATPAEQEILAQYVGWGSMPGAFNQYGQDAGAWTKERDEIAALLSPEEFAAAAKSTLNAHYTSGPIVAGMWEAARTLGFTGGRVLEPSMGVGNFFGLMPADLRGGSSLTGVELDNLTGRIAKQLYPQANVMVKGFEELKTPDGFFDLAISNVPFGDFKVHDKRYNLFGAPIHDYFFLKSLDQVRPGGLVMFITSTGTMDKGAARLRQAMAKKADLVAAIRLPEGAFQKNAGTAVVTDLIVFKRRADGVAPAGHPFDGIATVPDPAGGEPIPLNEYFVKHPEQVLGTIDRKSRMYGSGQPHVSATADFEQLWQSALDRLPSGVFEPTAKASPTFAKPSPIASAHTKDGGFVKGEKGKLLQRQGDALVEVEATGKQAKIVESTLKVRDALRDVINAQLDAKPAAEINKARKVLGKAYDEFVAKHGPLHKPENAKAFAGDPDAPVVLALENWDAKAKTATKSDAFTQNTIRGYERPTKASGPSEALGISLNETGRVDIDRIAELLGQAPEEAGKALVEKGIAFEDPANGWQSAERYLSGNVRRKLVEARAAAQHDSKRFGPNVRAQEKVQPEDVSYDEIDARLGVPWIGSDDIASFASELMGGSVDDFAIRYLPTSGEWFADYSPRGAYKHKGSINATHTYGTSRAPFDDILENALNNKMIVIRDRIDKDTTVVNVEETAAANGKIEDLQARFRDWIWQDDDRRHRLHRQYNDTFNNIAPTRYDGSHLQFPGMAPELNGKPFALREHQANAVWRTIVNGTALYGHEVGTGKTYTMVASAMELRRLGLARKPAIAVLKSTLPGFVKEAKEQYPNAKILAIENFDAKNRKQTISRIATGDWDLIILTHDNIDMLPMRKETQAGFIQRELDELTSVITAAEEAEGGSPSRGRGKGKKSDNRLVKKLENAKAKLEARLKGALESKQDDAVTFEETGIDHLFVDEAHEYKSLPVYTKQDRIKGIPSSRSDKATQMWMRTRWLQETHNGRGVVFATGTPITNTMAELYTMQRYLQGKELKERGIDAFDAWARNFGIITSRMETTVTGDYQQVSRFSQFVNLNELARIAGEVIDVQRAEFMPGFKRPARQDQVDVVPMTRAQKSYLADIKRRAIEAKKKKPGEPGDNMLSISMDARKAALDMRLVDERADADDSGKLGRVVAEVLRVYKADPTRTQMIFSDIGVHSTKWGFSAFDEIINQLVAGGIPAEKILNFSDLTDVQKRTASAKLKSGEALIGLGSSKKIGTGVNAQDFLYALHHLDVPWIPAYVEQRDGRGWRQGNKNLKILIRRYTTEGSFDTFMWQTVDSKTRFIKQFTDAMSSGKQIPRKMIEEDGEELTPAQIMAVTSGNPLMLEKINLDRDVADLDRAAKRHERDELKARDTVSRLKKAIVNLTDDLRDVNADAEAAQATGDISGDKFAIQLGKKTYADREEAATALESALKDVPRIDDEADAEQIGTIRGLPIKIWGLTWDRRMRVGVSGRAVSKVSVLSAEYDVRDSTLNNRRRDIENEIANKQKEQETAEGLLGQPFRKAQEFAEKKAKLAEVTQKMKDANKPPESPPPDGIAEQSGPSDIDELGGPRAAPRIQPAPLPGGGKRVSEISIDFQKAVGHKINVGKTGRRSGLYRAADAQTKIRFAGDLPTTAHEMAHFLDDAYNLMGDFQGGPSPYDKELMPHFSKHGSRPSPDLSREQRLTYRRAEGVAEWMRAFVLNPDATIKAAPLMYDRYLQQVPEKVRQAVSDFSDDVRRWAGSSAADKALSNVRTDMKGESLRERLSAPFKESPYFSTKTWFDQAKIALQDHLWPVVKGIAYAKQKAGRTDLLPSEDPETLMRLLPGFQDRYNEMLDSGLVDAKGEKVTEGGVSWLFEPLDSSTKETLERDIRAATALLIAERTIEKGQQIIAEAEAAITADPDMKPKRAELLRATAKQRANRIAGIGAGIEGDQAVAAGTIEELQADPELYERAKEAASRYRQWADASLKYAVEKGRYSQKQYDAIKKRNQYYADFHRVMDDMGIELPYGAGMGKRIGSAGSPVQKFTGSTREIENPFVNLLLGTYKMYREADRNEVMNSFAGLLRSDRTMYDGPQEAIYEIGRQVESGDPNAVRVWNKGEEEKWQFEPGIHEALKNYGQVDNPNGVARIMQIPGRITRTAITHGPAFVIRNVIRDAQTRAMVSETGSQPWDIFRKSTPEQFRQFRLSGGEQFGHYMASPQAWHKELRRRVAELADDRSTILMMPGKAIRGYAALSKGSEMIGRMAEFRSAYKKAKDELGYDDHNANLYAAAKARDILDFAVAGTLIGAINKYVPFTNASVQGTTRMLKAMKRNPKAFMARWALYALLPTMLMRAWNKIDDDDEEYRQLPAWRRDIFLNFKIGDIWLAIPKSHEVGAMSALADRAIDFAYGDKKALEGWAGTAWKSLIPFGPETLAGPLLTELELLANYSFFRDRNIVNSFEKDLDLSLRKGTKNASNLGQAIQWMTTKMGYGMDARAADYLIQSRLGSIGQLVTRASDVMREDRSIGTPFGGITGLMRRPEGGTSRDAQWVDEQLREMGSIPPLYATADQANGPAVMRRLRLRAAIKAYEAAKEAEWEAKTDAQKNDLAAKVREQAVKVRTLLEQDRDLILSEKQKKMQAKREADLADRSRSR